MRPLRFSKKGERKRLRCVYSEGQIVIRKSYIDNTKCHATR